MKNRMKPIGCALLILALLLSLPGLALAAAEPGVYTLTTDKGGSREPVYGEATLTVAADGAMTLELLLKSSMSGIKYLDQELPAGEAVTIDGVEYVPYTLTLAAPTDSLELSAYVAAMGRDVSLTVGLSGWENVPGAELPAEEAPAGEPPAEGIGAGEYPITVANASTSPYGATTVYPEATLTVAEDGSCLITICLKDSLANIRLEDGTPVPAGEAKTLSMNDEEGTYYPYTFPIAMRQAALTITDDVPAMSMVESMNYGKDMTTTINIDWTGTQGLVTALADGEYELPVALSSSMLSLDGLAQLTVSGGKYELTISVPEGLISEVRYGEDEIAPMRNDCNLDRFTLTLTEEASQIPVKVSVTKMKGTAMEVQSVVLVPDWTQAQPVTETAAPAGDVYDGDEVTFVKGDGEGFGMFTPQEGTTIALEGGMVIIHYVPKNTTVYNAIHWGFIEDAELTADLAFNEDGTFDIALPEAMCGKLIPVAPIKVKDGGTTKEQYYLAIPAADKLGEAPAMNLYEGDAVTFVKADGEGFGMFTPQEGTAIALEGGMVIIHYVPKNTTVYNAIHWGFIEDAELTPDLAFNEDGTFDIILPEAACGMLIPVAPIKVKDGGTTKEQYYLAIPAADKLGEALVTEPQIAASTQTLKVNGEEQVTEVYNIGGDNYFKLRDIAALLTGTGSQFSVDYDKETRTVIVKTGEAYALQEGDLTLGEDKSATAVPSSQTILIDGAAAELTAYNIGGNNFFQLKALGEALGFDVSYDAAAHTVLVNSK